MSLHAHMDLCLIKDSVTIRQDLIPHGRTIARGMYSSIPCLIFCSVNVFVDFWGDDGY